jgi:uncharacterized protein
LRKEIEEKPNFKENLMKVFINSLNEIERILKKEQVGFLSMVDNNIPYTIPITYCYDNGKIIFHCALKGKKLDIMKSNPNVCLTVGKQYGKIVKHPQGAVCHAHSNSIICNGKARIINNKEEKCKLLNIFNKCIKPDAREIQINEINNCVAVEIKIREMTGRIERNSNCKYYIYSFIK